MASPSFFQIPGNIKQSLLPFVINPNKKINKSVRSSTELVNKQPQVFSYKHGTSTIGGGYQGRLQFYPSSIDTIFVDDDISLKLLYERHLFDEGDKLLESSINKSIRMQDILNAIPGVQIREFLPDTRLDQCINLFTDMLGNMTKLFSGEKDTSQQGDAKKNTTEKLSIGESLKKIGDVSWFTMKYMVGAISPNFFDDLSFGGLPNLPFSSYKKEVYRNNIEYPGSFVMAFPYTLYYRLQSCTTTNIYEIPAQTSNKMFLDSSGGMQGWTDGGSDIMSSGELRMSGLLNKIPVIGSIANMILGNIGINYMPWWNAESGTKTKEPEIEIKFDLYNDSADAAVMNFIFINTIVPNNKWVQYNMFQHSSSLYDVKIEGINRLFACAGNFTVAYDGVLREPPYSLIKRLVDKHANGCMDKENFLKNLVHNKIIKIPDVYKVTMHFASLLPANFNNFIYTYAQNASQIVEYQRKGGYQQSAVAEMLPSAIKKYTERVSNVWNGEPPLLKDELPKQEPVKD